MQSALNTQPDFLINTAQINAKYAAIRDDPRRWHSGTFRIPSEVEYRSAPFRKLATAACATWIEIMRKKGWDLVDPPTVYGPRLARDPDTSVVLLGENAYLIRGLFKLASTPKLERIEIPPGIIRRDPEQTITAQEAMKALH